MTKMEFSMEGIMSEESVGLFERYLRGEARREDVERYAKEHSKETFTREEALRLCSHIHCLGGLKALAALAANGENIPTAFACLQDLQQEDLAQIRATIGQEFYDSFLLELDARRVDQGLRHMNRELAQLAELLKGGRSQ